MKNNNNSENKVKIIKGMFSKEPQLALGIKKIKLLDTDIGRAIVEYNAEKHMCHSGNIVQGGVIPGWLDASMAVACMAMAGEDVLVLSLEIKTTFINITTKGNVFAEGKVIKMGKNIAFLEGQLRNDKGLLLAQANQTVKLKYNFYKN